MATSIDMSSNALVLIGDDPISSFSDPGAGAQAAANLYPDTYRSILAGHPWTFALKEVFLSKLTQTPDDLTNYKSAFQLPTDLIRIWKIMSHSNYDVVGTLVYSNEDELLCRYVYNVDEVKLPPQVVKAIEYKLASEFAMLVTEDINKSDFFERKYLNQIALARSIDSQGHPQEKIVDSPFVDVRHGGYSRGGFY
jgi:hypothetical protein